MILQKLPTSDLALYDGLKALDRKDTEIFEMMRAITYFEDCNLKRDHHYSFVQKINSKVFNAITGQTKKYTTTRKLTAKTIAVDGFDLVFKDINTEEIFIINNANMHNFIVFYH